MFLGKWNFFAGERIIKRNSIICMYYIHNAFRHFIRTVYCIRNEIYMIHLNQRNLRIKTFFNIRRHEYWCTWCRHDIWLDQWIKVCKRSSEQTRTFPPTCPRSNIEEFTSILEYLRQSCQSCWPVSIVSVNFDHRSVTLFRDERCC